MVAPFAVNTVDCPGQIVLLASEILGLGVTVKEVVTWAVQVPFAPITETLVDEAGLSVKVLPVTFPGFQV